MERDTSSTSHPGEPSDAELTRAYAAERSQAAFEALVRRHVDLVYSTAVRLLGDRHAAEDVAQSVFVLLARRCRGMDDRVILPAWLYRATRYACATHRKAEARRRRREAVAARERSTVADTVAMASGGDPSGGAWADVMPILDDAMGDLPDADRTALLLRYFQGMPVNGVAASLRLSANATSQRLSRALAKLRTALARRGVTVPADLLASGLAVRLVHPAPASLAAHVAAKATAMAATASASKGALITMAAMTTKAKLIAVGSAALLLLLGTTVVLVARSRSGHGGGDLTVVPISRAAQGKSSSGNVGPGARPVTVGGYPDYIRGGTRAVFGVNTLPRRVFTTIEAEFAEVQGEARQTPPGLEFLSAGGWAEYGRVDFSGGADAFVARVFVPSGVSPDASLVVRLDTRDGPAIVRLPLAPTTSARRGWAALRSPLTVPVTGVHDVFLQYAGSSGGCELGSIDWFKFVRNRRPAIGRIPASSYDDMEGVRDHGEVLSNLDTGDYLRYSGIDFGSGEDGGGGVAWFHAWVGVSPERPGRVIEVRLDRLDGPVIARLKLAPTGAYATRVVQSAIMSHVAGIHDVYLTIVGDAACDLEWIGFSAGRDPPPAPATQPTSQPTTAPTTQNSTASG